MQISEFLPQPNATFQHPQKISSRLGSFFVELKPAEGEPDAQMLLHAEELIHEFEAAKEDLEQAVYREYLDASQDQEWMAHCAVPPGLALTRLSPYIFERVLIVYRYQNRSRDENAGPEYLRQVYLRPKWDEARCLFFEFHDGKWNRLDF